VIATDAATQHKKGSIEERFRGAREGGGFSGLLALMRVFSVGIRMEKETQIGAISGIQKKRPQKEFFLREQSRGEKCAARSFQNQKKI